MPPKRPKRSRNDNEETNEEEAIRPQSRSIRGRPGESSQEAQEGTTTRRSNFTTPVPMDTRRVERVQMASKPAESVPKRGTGPFVPVGTGPFHVQVDTDRERHVPVGTGPFHRYVEASDDEGDEDYGEAVESRSPSPPELEASTLSILTTGEKLAVAKDKIKRLTAKNAELERINENAIEFGRPWFDIPPEFCHPNGRPSIPLIKQWLAIDGVANDADELVAARYYNFNGYLKAWYRRRYVLTRSRLQDTVI